MRMANSLIKTLNPGTTHIEVKELIGPSKFEMFFKFGKDKQHTFYELEPRDKNGNLCSNKESLIIQYSELKQVIKSYLMSNAQDHK